MSRRALQTAVRVHAGALFVSALIVSAPISASGKQSDTRVAVKQTQTTVQTFADVPIDDDGEPFDTVPAPVNPKAPSVPADVRASTDGGLSIVCPVAGAKFQNDYGAPRAGHAHAGNDMLAPRGTPILAPMAGLVKHKWSSLGGLSFYLDTPSGVRFFGTHLQSAGASGQVDAGAVIGFVGDTGNARGTPHLHFEYHPTKKSKANPYSLLVRACRTG